MITIALVSPGTRACLRTRIAIHRPSSVQSLPRFLFAAIPLETEINRGKREKPERNRVIDATMGQNTYFPWRNPGGKEKNSCYIA